MSMYVPTVVGASPMQVFIPSDHANYHVTHTGGGSPDALPQSHDGTVADFVRISFTEQTRIKFGASDVAVGASDMLLDAPSFPFVEIVGIPPGATHVDATAGTLDITANY